MSGLSVEDREDLMDAVAAAMRDLSVRIGVREYAVPLAQGVDVVIAVRSVVEAIVARHVTAALTEAADAIEALADRRLAAAIAAEGAEDPDQLETDFLSACSWGARLAARVVRDLAAPPT